MKQKQFVGVPSDVTINDVGPASEVCAHVLVEDVLEATGLQTSDERWRTLALLAAGMLVFGLVIMPVVDAYHREIYVACEAVRHALLR
jgi:hypothetical protein